MRGMMPALMLMAAPLAAQTAPPPGGFEVKIDHRIAASPAVVYDRLVRVASWWTPAHSYSGDAANLVIEPRAGGCWCESWAGGSVEHGRVLAAMPGRLLRVSGGFGPLQERPVGAVLTFALTPLDKGTATALAVRYRVSGAADLETPVAAVINAQIDRLVAALQ